MKSPSANGLWDPPGEDGYEQNTKQATVTAPRNPSPEEAGTLEMLQKWPDR